MSLENFTKCYYEKVLSLTKGPVSVIGQTRSGKDIYTATHGNHEGIIDSFRGGMPTKTTLKLVGQAYPDFTARDHSDAALAQLEKDRATARGNSNAYMMHMVHSAMGSRR